MAIEINAKTTALLIQDLQNDVISEGGAFADSGAPAHAKSQNVVANVIALAAAGRRAGMAIIHVHDIVEPGAPGLKLNAPLFQGVKEANAVVRGSWGAAPVDGLEPQEGDFVVEKMRMNGFMTAILRPFSRVWGPIPSSFPAPGRISQSSIRRATAPMPATGSWSSPTAPRRSMTSGKMPE